MQTSFDRLEARHPAARVARIWKRDGTRNVMSLAAAACNLEGRSLLTLTAEEAAAVLLAGEWLETKYALFRLERGRAA